jgi:D-alanyl-D-alanine carboxypeptidase (penicillin-binding protein 5/6)
VYTRPATNLQPQLLMHQHNALVKSGSKFYYSKATGIKTGYTNQAGYTLIGAAEDAQRKLVAVLLGCENLDQRYRDAIAMFEAAFNEKRTSRTLFSKEFDVFTTHIVGGKTALQATLANDCVVAYYPSEAESLHSAVHWEEKNLPIRKEERVGQVRIFSERGQLVASQPLFAIGDVDPTLRYVIKGKWQSLKQALRAHHSYVLVLLGAAFLVGAFVVHGRRKKVKER